MKIKNLFFTLSIVFISTFSASGQSRENRETLKFITKSEKLKTAIGWKQNKETGKWIDNKNVYTRARILHVCF